MSHAVPAYRLGGREIPLTRLEWPERPRGHCTMLVAAVDGEGFDFRDGTKFKVDVGCETSGCGLLFPCRSPSVAHRQFWTLVLCRAWGRMEEQGPVWEPVGAALLSAFSFAFKGFPGQECIPEPCCPD